MEASIVDIASSASSKNAQWFSLLGNAPLREVVQTALGLPGEIASIDIDKQLETFQERAQSVFGTDDISDFVDPELRDTITRLFLVRASISTDNGFSSGSVALTLLRG